MQLPATARAKVTWTHTDSAAGGAAAQTITAPGAGKATVIKKIVCSYSAVTTAVEDLTVTSGGTTIFKASLPSGSVGPHQFDFGQSDDGMGLNGGANAEVVVTLSAGAGALVAQLSVGHM
jgi:hypothetical protein